MQREQTVARKALLNLSLVLAVLLAACSTASDQALSPGGRPLDEMSDFQSNLLSDGELEFSEYESAVFAMVECLRAEGIETSDPHLQENNTYSFSTRDPAPQNAEAFESDFSMCYAEHLSAIEFEWADVIAPSPAEEDKFYDGVVQCVRDSGVTALSSESSELERIQAEHPDIFENCFQEAVEEDQTNNGAVS